MLGSCDDDGVVVLDVLAGSPVAGSEGVVELVPSSCEDGGELMCSLSSSRDFKHN